MKAHFNIKISPPSFDCQVVIGKDLFQEAFQCAKKIAERVVIVTTSSVSKFFLLEKDTIILPDGESIKSRSMKEKLEDLLIEREIGQECCLMAIGGGALLDLVGFVSATYCRGIPYISYPTTLIAMTDAALGGKTGVNVVQAKNWIGAFYHPEKVFIDLLMLNTLSDYQYAQGMIESIKHALIADQAFFAFFEENLEKLLAKDPDILLKTVLKSCQIKKNIVEKDPYEKEKLRRILNFGHTLAHALETHSFYCLSHGEAVAMGILIESKMAFYMKFLSRKTWERIKNFFTRLPLTFIFPGDLSYQQLKRDKKGKNKIVILSDIGQVHPCKGEYVEEITEEIFNQCYPCFCAHP